MVEKGGEIIKKSILANFINREKLKWRKDMYTQSESMNDNLWYKPQTKVFDANKQYEKQHREFVNQLKRYGRQNFINNYNQNCYMKFDGNNLDLYNSKGKFDSLDAQSGYDGYQSRIYQNITNRGPIPEGTYYANQDQRQYFTFQNLALKLGEKMGINKNKKSQWSGNPMAWGTSRVWLQPDANTNTYNRSGFSIHGGLNKGSAGCIDIPWQTGVLNDYLDNCQESVPLYVKYPSNW